MKAVAKCPKCGEVITTDCVGCVGSGTAAHICKDRKEWDVIDVKWRVIDCTKDDVETLKRLKFKGELPEVLN